MESLNHLMHLQTTQLSTGHCNDIACPHPSCWASRKLYRRNMYLAMLKGEPISEAKQESEVYSALSAERKKAASLPTQKVHNLLHELFNSAGQADAAADSDETRLPSAEQQSIKHMPTPTSCLSRNTAKRPGRPPEGEGEEEGEEDAEATATSGRPVRRRQAAAAAAAARVSLAESFNPTELPAERQLVWVPNPNRREKNAAVTVVQDRTHQLNINEELDLLLTRDDADLHRSTALQHERTSASAARFFRSAGQGQTNKHANVDLFKLPSEVLSEVLKNVDSGEPMTDESLQQLVERAESADFRRFVLQQRRVQLHQSDWRNVREPQKHSRSPVFLLDKSDDLQSVGGRQGKPRLPPIRRQQQRATRVSAKRNRRRAVRSGCQLMLGPVSDSSESPASSLRSGGSGGSGGSRRLTASESDRLSLDTQCRSDRSTLLDEVMPVAPQTTRMGSDLASLLLLRRPTYELDDPWSDATAQPAPHPTRAGDSHARHAIAVSVTPSEPVELGEIIRERDAWKEDEVEEEEEEEEDEDLLEARAPEVSRASSTADGLRNPPASPEMETVGDSAEVQQDGTEVQQDGAEVQQDSAEVHQDSAEMQQDSAEVHQDSAEMQQDSAEVQQDSAEMQQDSAEVQQDSAEVQQDGAEVQQDSTEMQQDSAEVQQGSAEMQQGSAEMQQDGAEVQQDGAEVQQDGEGVQKDAANTLKDGADSQKDGADTQKDGTSAQQDSAGEQEDKPDADGNAAQNDIRAETADTKKDAADTKEDAADTKEDAADTKEDAADTKEDAADTKKEDAADTKEDAADTKEDAADTKKEDAADTKKEDAADTKKEDAADTKEDAADTKEDAADTKKNAADTTEDAADTTEDAADSQQD